jgi:hypothetical protein
MCKLNNNPDTGGKHALAYTEVTYHASSMKNNRQQYLDLEIKAYKAAASYLAIADSTVFDKKQNRLVMSPPTKRSNCKSSK